MKKKYLTLLFCFFVCVFGMWAEELYNGGGLLRDDLVKYLPENVADELLQAAHKDGKASVTNMKYTKKAKKAALTPNSAIANKVSTMWKGENPIFLLETLYLYKKPSSLSGKKDVKRISDVLHSVSTLQGLEYYSTSRKTMRTLYEVSSAVKPVQSGKKVVYEKIADNLEADEQLVLQKDLTFGEYVYRYSYIVEDDGVGFVCENTEKIKYGLFTLVDPESMNISLTVLDLGDYLLAYALTRANFPKIIGLESKLKNSFSTRTDAVYNWFIENYEKR